MKNNDTYNCKERVVKPKRQQGEVHQRLQQSQKIGSWEAGVMQSSSGIPIRDSDKFEQQGQADLTQSVLDGTGSKNSLDKGGDKPRSSRGSFEFGSKKTIWDKHKKNSGPLNKGKEKKRSMNK